MIASNSLPEFMICGNLVNKLKSTSGSREKYIWATKEELRWSESSQSLVNYSKLAYDSILSVRTQEKTIGFLLLLDTPKKTYKFSFKSSQTLEKWQNGIKQAISLHKYNSLQLSKSKPQILSDSNYEPKQTSNVQISKELIEIAKHYSKYCDQAKVDENDPNPCKSLEEIAAALSLKTQETQISSKKLEENDPRKIVGRISMLRKKVKMLEIEKDSSDQIENIQAMIEREKQQNQYLKTKIEEATAEKTKAAQDLSALKDELVKARELKISLEAPCEKSEDYFGVIQEVLKKGFVCYISILSSPEYSSKLVLTPRRGHEEGVYKKRQVKYIADQLIWKAVGLFTCKTIALKISDICTIVDGTEDPERYEPFSNHRYITIITKKYTAMMCVENTFGVFLDGIRDTYLKYNGIICSEAEVKPTQILRLSSEQLQNQILMYSRLYKRYKNSLVDSISTINIGSQSFQSFFDCEIAQLKFLNENLPIGIMAADAECYLRNERKNLVERINALQEFISTQSEKV